MRRVKTVKNEMQRETAKEKTIRLQERVLKWFVGKVHCKYCSTHRGSRRNAPWNAKHIKININKCMSEFVGQKTLYFPDENNKSIVFILNAGNATNTQQTGLLWHTDILALVTDREIRTRM